MRHTTLDTEQTSLCAIPKASTICRPVYPHLCAAAPSQVPADQLPECGPLLPDSLSPPPKAVVAAVFQVTGLENYTCIDGR